MKTKKSIACLLILSIAGAWHLASASAVAEPQESLRVVFSGATNENGTTKNTTFSATFADQWRFIWDDSPIEVVSSSETGQGGTSWTGYCGRNGARRFYIVRMVVNTTGGAYMQLDLEYDAYTDAPARGGRHLFHGSARQLSGTRG